jgi:hypothetical protein
VRVPHSEGVANHTDALSWDAEAVLGAEGNMDGRDVARSGPIPRGQRPWHVQTLLEREPARDRLPAHGPNREGEEPKPMI